MLLLIPILLPVISGTILLIKKWKKKPWRRPRFILLSALVNSAVVLGFLIAQYSEACKVTLSGTVTFWLAADGLGFILAGCMAVFVPAVLCYCLDFGEEQNVVRDPEFRQNVRKEDAEAGKNKANARKKNAEAGKNETDARKKKAIVRKEKEDSEKEKSEIQKSDGKRDVLSALFNYLFAAVTGVAFSKNMATLSFFLMITLLLTACVVWRTGKSEKCWWILFFGGAAAVLVVLAVAVIAGNGATFYFDGYLSGSMSEQLLRILYLFGFCGCSARAILHPILVDRNRVKTGEKKLMEDENEENSPTLEKMPVFQAGNLLLDAIFIFVLVRLTFSVFGISLLRGTWVQVAVMVISVAGIAAHSVLALREEKLHRKFDYLYGASFSMILTGIAVMTSHGYTAAVWAFVGFISAQLLLVFFLGVVREKTGALEMSVVGLGRKMPMTFACYVAASLSICAVPPFAGFLSVWKLAKAFTRQGGLNYLSMAAMFFFLFLAAMSMYPTVVRAFLPKREPVEKVRIDEASLQMLVPMVVLAAAVLAVGLLSGMLGDYIYQVGLGLM